jgi:hypothetical protein
MARDAGGVVPGVGSEGRAVVACSLFKGLGGQERVAELCEARQRAANGRADGIQGAYGTHKVGNCLQSVPDNDRAARR